MTTPSSTRRRRWPLLLGAALLLLAGRLLYTVWVAGELRSVESRGIDRCVRLPGIVGGEDIALDRGAAGGEGVFWIAADDRRAAAAGTPQPGRLYRLAATAVAAEDVTPELAVEFHPHGLSVARLPSRSAEGQTGLMLVVNHRAGGVFDTRGDAIERFQIFDDARLRHDASVQDPLLIAMNDVAALPDGRFYTTLDHGEPSGPLRKVEDFARMPWSGVAYWDGERARRVASGLRYANGIALSADGGTVYVAATSDGAVVRYDRDPSDGSLRERARIACGTGVDNIDVAADGSLWLGAHPKLVTFLRHAGDASVPSPSQVLRIAPERGNCDVVVQDDGRLFSGSAAAAALPLAIGETRVLVGPVFAPHLLDCRLPKR